MSLGLLTPDPWEVGMSQQTATINLHQFPFSSVVLSCFLCFEGFDVSFLSFFLRKNLKEEVGGEDLKRLRKGKECEQVYLILQICLNYIYIYVYTCQF